MQNIFKNSEDNIGLLLLACFILRYKIQDMDKETVED